MLKWCIIPPFLSSKSTLNHKADCKAFILSILLLLLYTTLLYFSLTILLCWLGDIQSINYLFSYITSLVVGSMLFPYIVWYPILSFGLLFRFFVPYDFKVSYLVWIY